MRNKFMGHQAVITGALHCPCYDHGKCKGFVEVLSVADFSITRIVPGFRGKRCRLLLNRRCRAFTQWFLKPLRP